MIDQTKKSTFKCDHGIEECWRNIFSIKDQGNFVGKFLEIVTISCSLREESSKLWGFHYFPPQIIRKKSPAKTNISSFLKSFPQTWQFLLENLRFSERGPSLKGNVSFSCKSTRLISLFIYLLTDSVERIPLFLQCKRTVTRLTDWQKSSVLFMC